MKRKNPAAVSLGRKGGKAGTGAAKARTSEQARAAALARWKTKKATGPQNEKAQPRSGESPSASSGEQP